MTKKKVAAKAEKAEKKPGTTAKTSADKAAKPRRQAAAAGTAAAPKRRPITGRATRTEAAPSPSAAAARSNRESRDAAEAAIEAALDKKALMSVLIDVRDQASYTDFIGVVSGRSDRQVDAIAENVSRAMAERGRRLLGREGTGNGRWTLLDFGDVVLHVFYHPVREVYDIESLWIDAPRVKLDVPEEARIYQPDALYGSL